MDEAFDVIEELELDDDEAEYFLDGMEYADENGDLVVTYDEMYDAVWEAVEDDAELRAELMQGIADFADEFDVDCSADGVEGCDDERAAFHEEIAEWAEEDEE